MDAFKAISAGKAAIDGFKLLAAYAEDVQDIQKRGELMRIIGHLSLELAEVEIKLAEQIRENAELKETVRALEKQIEESEAPTSKLKIKGKFYYTDTEPEDGPFCTACYDSKQQRIRIVSKLLRNTSNVYKYQCPVCSVTY